MVQNIGHRQHRLSEPWNLTIRSGETVDVPFDAAMTLSKNPEFTILWEDTDYKHSDKPGKLTHLTYLSPLHGYDGYGVVGCNTLKNFAKYGITAYTPHPIRSLYRTTLAREYPEVLELVDRPVHHPTKVGLCHTIPPDIELMKTPIRINWTMYEAEMIDHAWSRYVDQADALIVPSTGQVDVFRNSGYNRDIYVVPDGMEVDTWQYTEREDHETYNFFTWGRLSSRKCPWELIHAFVVAFEGINDVTLTLKTRDGELGMGRTFGVNTIKINDPRIKVIDADWSRTQLVEALRNADCAVFASRGEGFSNCPLQAALTGLPTISSCHSGMTDWCKAPYFVPIQLDKNAPLVDSPLGKRDGKVLRWWNPDFDELARQMRYAYDHRKEMKDKGKKASAWVRKNYSVDVMMQTLVRVLDRFA